MSKIRSQEKLESLRVPVGRIASPRQVPPLSGEMRNGSPVSPERDATRARHY